MPCPPSLALREGLSKKADAVEVYRLLDRKADATAVTEALQHKASQVGNLYQLPVPHKGFQADAGVAFGRVGVYHDGVPGGGPRLASRRCNGNLGGVGTGPGRCCSSMQMNERG